MKRIAIPVIAFASAIAIPSTSGAFSCGGLITYLGVDNTANVAVSIQGTVVHKICNLDSQGMFSVTPAACKAMYATLLAGRTLGKSTTIFYTDDGKSCSTLPSWQPVYNVTFVEAPW